MPSAVRRPAGPVSTSWQVVLAWAVLAGAVHVEAAESWRIRLPADSQISPSASRAIPLPDGGALLGLGDHWVRVDEAGAALGPPVAAALRIGHYQAHGDSGLVHIPMPSDVLGDFPEGQICHRSGDLAGLGLRQFSSYAGVQIASAMEQQVGELAFATVLDFDAEPGLQFTLRVYDAACNERILDGLMPSSAPLPERTGQGVFVVLDAPTRLAHVDAQGERWALPLAAGAHLLATSADGDVLLREGGELLRISPDGQLRWRSPLPDIQTFPTVIANAQATHLLLGEFEMGRLLRQRLYTLDTKGEPLGERLLDGELLSSRLPAISGAPRWWTQPPRPASGPFPQGPTRVVEIADDGSLAEVASLEPGERPLASLLDGSLLSRRASDLALVRYPAQGAAPLLVERPAVPARRELLALEHKDGLGVLALRENFSTIQLIAVDERGALRWRRTLADDELPTAVDADSDRYQLALGSDLGCLWQRGWQNDAVACFSLDHGRQLGARFAMPLRFADEQVALRFGTDQSLHVVGRRCAEASGPCLTPQLVRAVVGITGSLMDMQELGPAERGWQWNASGEIAWLDAEGEAPLHFVDADGRALGSASPPPVRRLLALGAAGEVLLGGPFMNGEQIEAWSIPQNRLRWQRRLPRDDGFGSTLDIAALRGGDWLLRTLDQQPQVARVLRVDGSAGDVLWQSRLARIRFQGSEPLARDADIEQLWLAPILRPEGRLLGIDLEDGRPRFAAGFGSPRTAPATAPRLGLLAPAAGRLLVAALDPSDASLEIAGFDLSTSPDDRPPANASAGIWHAPDAAGQGLLLELTEQDDALTGAWFRFTLAGGSLPAALRWSALQGPRGDDGRFALTLFEASGGQFAAPPAAEVIEVGEARFELLSCDRALFTYRFTDGLSGAMPLQRTAGQGTGCAPPPAIDPPISEGSYFNPAQDGQGLLLRAVQTVDGMQLTGAWFTFDPAGATNDPGAQHWFTLLGPLAPTGSSEVTLLRSSGGRFDLEPTATHQPVGSLRLTPQAGCALQVEWRFDDSVAAESFAGLQGELGLQRIGGCAEASAALRSQFR